MRAMLAALVVALSAVGAVVPQPSSAAEGPTLHVGDQSGLERDLVTGSVFVPIYLSEPAAEPVVVSYWTVDGTAIAGVDYTRWGTPASPRTVTIPAGGTQTQVNVPILTDDDVEDDETFSLVATATGGGVVVGDDTGTATIVDADPLAGPNPVITVSNPTVVEGHNGQRRAQFLIHLSRPPGTNVTITYTTADGTAAAGVDYVAKLPGTVVFAPGQISKSVDVLVDANTSLDGNRAFALDVTVTGGSPVEELTMSGTATIIDDDTAPAEPCPPGTYNSTDGNQPCTPAPPGYFVDTTGALAATPCAPGSFQAQASQTACELAPIGSYVQNAASTEATLCPDGTTTDTTGATSPDDCVPVPSGAVAIAAGSGHSCALLSGGTVSCWGSNTYGQLGNGTYTSFSVPVAVSGITDAVAIASGHLHSCALLADGAVRCWGWNGYGQLGNGVIVDPDQSVMDPSNVPVTVVGLTDATAITAGYGHSCALLANGTARCWGQNNSAQLGRGTYTVGSSVPAAVSGLTDATAIAAGHDHSCALLANASVTCWGNNGQGQLGIGTYSFGSSVPAAVPGLTDVTAIAVGYLHSCALLADGTARCWGYNTWGQLGTGITPNSGSTVPVAVSGIADATAITAGSGVSCALLADDTARCWGYNDSGRLGNGTTTNSNVPTAVSGISDATVIIAGNGHTCALLADGTARCWGSNSVGQLGNGATGGNSTVPVIVSGLP